MAKKTKSVAAMLKVGTVAIRSIDVQVDGILRVATEDGSPWFYFSNPDMLRLLEIAIKERKSWIRYQAKHEAKNEATRAAIEEYEAHRAASNSTLNAADQGDEPDSFVKTYLSDDEETKVTNYLNRPKPKANSVGLREAIREGFTYVPDSVNPGYRGATGKLRDWIAANYRHFAEAVDSPSFSAMLSAERTKANPTATTRPKPAIVG
jgi:hypothetical protein